MYLQAQRVAGVPPDRIIGAKDPSGVRRIVLHIQKCNSNRFSQDLVRFEHLFAGAGAPMGADDVRTFWIQKEMIP